MSSYPKSTISAITDFLFLESDIEPSDLIFVFGNDWDATMHDVHALYVNGISNKILISGRSAHGNRSESEAQRFMRKGLELGIPTDAFILEENSSNTKENICFSLPLIERNIGLDNISRIVFVCKTFHTRRVLMTARKHFPTRIEYFFLPVLDERNISKDNWWIEAEKTERVVGELRRISEYTIKGDLSIF